MIDDKTRDILNQVLYYVDPDDYQKRIEDQLNLRTNLIRNYFGKKIDTILDKNSINSPVLLTELFFSSLGEKYLAKDISERNSKKIYDYLGKLKTPVGFRPIANPEKKWRNKPRIYSTFYAIAELSLIGTLKEYLTKNDSWRHDTIRWVLSLQTKSNGGSFVESDCPSTKIPELTFWSLYILNSLQTDAPEQFFENFENARNWILSFLQQRNKLSATRIFFCLNCLHHFFPKFRIDSHLENKLIKFIGELICDNSFNEFLINEVKAQYRKEKTSTFGLLHSTYFGLKALEMLNYDLSKFNKLKKNAQTFVKKLEPSNGGYGIPIYIKDYQLYPIITPLETICALLIITL